MGMEAVSALVSEVSLRALLGVSVASIVGSVMSLVIRYTGTQFLALESLHMILAAAATGYLVALFVQSVPPEVVAYVVMALFVVVVSYMTSRGYEQNLSIATVAFVSASIASLASYGLAVYSPVGPSIVYNILFGSPFFLRAQDLLASIYTGAAILLVAALLWRRTLLMSFDPDYFEFLVGPRKALYHRLLVYVLIAVSAVYLTRVVGAIASHILLIAPSMTPLGRRHSVASVVAVFLAVSVSSVIVSVYTNTPFGASLGLIALAVYVAPALVFSRRP